MGAYSFVSGFGTLQQGSEPGREPGSEHGNPEPTQNEPGTPQDSDLTIKHVLSMIYLITVQLSRRLNSTADQNFGLVAGLAAGFASGFDGRVRTRPSQRSMIGSNYIHPHPTRLILRCDSFTEDFSSEWYRISSIEKIGKLRFYPWTRSY